jgi:ABC-type multidrug transport system fused ATPase/permease subunit
MYELFKKKQESTTNENEETNPISKINDINDFFKLPIYYNTNKSELNDNIISDLELVHTIDPTNDSIYSYYFNHAIRNNDISKVLLKQISKYYTNDILFLKDNQKLLQKYNKLENKYSHYSPNYKNIIEIWDDLKIENGFKEKYYYIDWEMLEFLNKSEFFLQFMSIYNLFSPIITLFIPIIILIIPFFIIKLKGLQLSINEYIEVLKLVATHNALGKLLVSNFSEISLNETIYIFISAAFYLFSIYQNVMVCVRFHKNMIKIHHDLNEMKTYLNNTILSMQNYLSYSCELNTHQHFNNTLREKCEILQVIHKKLSYISEYKLTNVNKFNEIGFILKYFYELHDNKIYNDAIMYSFGFHGYIDCIEGIIENIHDKQINFATFIPDNKKSIMKNSYYACLKDDNPVKNTIKFKKNIIITGPNASGKTTILKSTLINLIFTQQFGCGFYDSSHWSPFKYIHCYLNIPDTSGRDSLFQAEARRCKEIIDIINNNPTEKHFCLFDELYSGTNPEEAQISATAFMMYLIKNKNIFCLLTTHFIEICNNLNTNKSILNCHMVTCKNNNKIQYTYKINKGISNVKGGINVLYDMNYPREIIEDTIKIQNKL